MTTTIGNHLRMKRHELGFSKTSASLESGISFPTIVSIERGDKVSFRSLQKYATFLGVELEIKIKDNETNES